MRKPFVLLIALLSACGQNPTVENVERQPATQRFVDPKRIAALQEVADKACRCTRGGAAKDACWSDFWKEVNDYRHSSWASACGPGSSAFVEFDSAKGESPTAIMTVMTEYGYGACSADENATKMADYEHRATDIGC